LNKINLFKTAFHNLFDAYIKTSFLGKLVKYFPNFPRVAYKNIHSSRRNCLHIIPSGRTNFSFVVGAAVVGGNVVGAAVVAGNVVVVVGGCVVGASGIGGKPLLQGTKKWSLHP